MNSTHISVRASNIELFRLVAMLLVLVLHANYLSFGNPTFDDATNFPLETFARSTVYTASVICVNCFVLISGWFGIKPRTNRLAEFLFQVAFMVAVGIVGMCLFTDHHLDGKDVKGIFLLTDNLWFVKSYLVLYLIAPALNAFAESASRRRLVLTLVALYTLQTACGWAFVVVPWVADGYSPVSFILLYLLARCLRLHPSRLTHQRATVYAVVYILCAVVGGTVALLALRHGFDANMWINSYASPLVVIEAATLMLLFTRFQFHNRAINWLASSCFAVYLLHCSRGMLDEYCQGVRDAWAAFGILGIIVLILSVFFLSILIDKVRMSIWKAITNLHFK